MSVKMERSCWARLGRVCAGLAVGLAWMTAPGLEARESSSNRLDYMVIVTGGELLEGAYPDAHVHYITRALGPMGLHCIGAMMVDDRAADIKDALDWCSRKAPLVVVTGGLGPTENDVTRQALAQWSGQTLVENPVVVADLERRYRQPRAQMRETVRRQTLVPKDGAYLPNPNGSAVGLIFDRGECVAVALPGPPRELQPMVAGQLVPYLSRRFGTRTQACTVTLRFVGVGQSQVAQILKDHVPVGADITQGSIFEGGRVDFSFSLPDPSPASQARLKELEARILEHLAEYFYADDGASLEDRVAGLLKTRGVTLVVADAATSGAFAASLSQGAGAGSTLAGGWAAPGEEALARLAGIARPAGAQPGEAVRELAQALPGGSAPQWRLVIGEPRKDDAGAGYVMAALRTSASKCETRRFEYGGASPAARAALVTRLLDWLRRAPAGV